MRFDSFNDLLPGLASQPKVSQIPKIAEVNQNLLKFKRAEALDELKSVTNLNLDSKRKKVKELQTYVKDLANLIVVPSQGPPRRYLLYSLLQRTLHTAQSKVKQINEQHFYRMKMVSKNLAQRIQNPERGKIQEKLQKQSVFRLEFNEYYDQTEGVPLRLAWWMPIIQNQIKTGITTPSRSNFVGKFAVFENLFALICYLKRSEEYRYQINVLKERSYRLLQCHNCEPNSSPEQNVFERVKCQLFSQSILESRLTFVFDSTPIQENVPTYFDVINQCIINYITSPISRCKVEEQIEREHKRLRTELYLKFQASFKNSKTVNFEQARTNLLGKEIKPQVIFQPAIKRESTIKLSDKFSRKQIDKNQITINSKSLKREYSDLRQLSIIKSARQQEEEEQIPIESYSRKKKKKTNIKMEQDASESQSTHGQYEKEKFRRNLDGPQVIKNIQIKNYKATRPQYVSYDQVRIAKPLRPNQNLRKQIELILPQNIKERKIGSDTFAIYQVPNRSKLPPTPISQQFQIFRKQREHKTEQVFSQLMPVPKDNNRMNQNNSKKLMPKQASHNAIPEQETTIKQKAKSILQKLSLNKSIQLPLQQHSFWYPYNIESLVVDVHQSYLQYYFPSIDQQQLALHFMIDKIKHQEASVRIVINQKDSKTKELQLFKYMTVLTLLGAKVRVKVTDRASQSYNKKGQAAIKALAYLSGLPTAEVVRDRAASNGLIY